LGFTHTSDNAKILQCLVFTARSTIVQSAVLRQVHSQGPSEQKLMKIWEKRERGRIQGLFKFLEYPLLSQGRVELRTSNFVRTFIQVGGVA